MPGHKFLRSRCDERAQVAIHFRARPDGRQDVGDGDRTAFRFPVFPMTILAILQKQCLPSRDRFLGVPDRDRVLACAAWGMQMTLTVRTFGLVLVAFGSHPRGSATS